MDSDECRPMIRKEGSRLYRKSVSGRSEAEFLGVTGDAVPTDVSRDGTFVYSLGTRPQNERFGSLKDFTRRKILATPSQEHHTMFSPDGRRLAYASNASGRHGLTS
jgi:hypothetical protein